MRKILCVGNFFFPNGNASGSRVLGNGYLFRELGFDIFYIGLDCNLTNYSLLIDTKQLFKDFRYYNLPYPKGIKGWISYKKRYKEVVSLIESEDLYAVILYGSPTISLFGKLIERWCKKNNIKFTVDVVDWLSAGSGGFLFRIAKFIDTAYQKRLLNTRADGVIAISSYLANYYYKKGCETVIIPPLVNTDSFQKVDVTRRNGIIKLIYVGQPFPTDGRIVKEKSYKDRLDKVIDVLSDLKELSFLFNVFGLTKEQYLFVIPNHKHIIDALGDKIKFNGYLVNNEVRLQIANSDFTVLFRDVNRMTTAGFPTKFVESISCGTPVITTRTSDLERYLIDKKNGYFVDIECKDKLLSKMQEILASDRTSINLMKTHCMQSKLFSFNKFKNEMGLFLNSI